MRSLNIEDLNIQARTQGENEVFSFSLPKGTLSSKHLEAFFEFFLENEVTEVNLSIQDFFFTAMNDKHFVFENEELYHMECIIKLLTKLSCRCKPRN